MIDRNKKDLFNYKKSNRGSMVIDTNKLGMNLMNYGGSNNNLRKESNIPSAQMRGGT